MVYPHMKIDCTLIDKEYLAKAEIEICDYMDENEKKVDNYLDYVVFNDTDETIVTTIKKKPYKYRNRPNQCKKRTSRTVNTDEVNVLSDKQIGINILSDTEKNVKTDYIHSNNRSSDIQNDEAIQIEETLAVGILQKDMSVNEEIINEVNADIIDEVIEDIIEIQNEGIIDYDNEGIIEEVNEDIIENVTEDVIEETIEDVNEDIIEGENDEFMEVEALDEDLVNYEVLDLNGCEFVKIGGVLYKIEREK